MSSSFNKHKNISFLIEWTLGSNLTICLVCMEKVEEG